MEESKIKNIEESLDAFRAINDFWFMAGPYPKYSSVDIWSEEDYKDEQSRRIMREDFERHLEKLAYIYNTHIKTLYYAVPCIESEYNNIVINARNMEQAISLLKEKFENAMFSLENECNNEQILKNYLLPLKEHGIITFKEGYGYQDLVEYIVMRYNSAVIDICSVFHLEHPWNKDNPDKKQIPNNNIIEEHDPSAQNTELHAEVQQSTTSAHTDSFDSEPFPPKTKDTANYTKPKGNRGRKQAFSNLSEKSLCAIIESIYDNFLILDCNKIAESIKNEIKNCKEDKDRAPLVVALEVCELIPVLEDGNVNGFCDILNEEMSNIIEYRTFINHYNNYSPLREKAMKQETKQVNELKLKEIIYWKKKIQEIKQKFKKSAS